MKHQKNNGKILPGSTLTRQNFYTLTILQQIQKFPYIISLTGCPENLEKGGSGNESKINFCKSRRLGICPDLCADQYHLCGADDQSAVSGADLDKLMEGAATGRDLALNKPFAENDAMQYAAVRNILLRKGKSVEVLANYEPSLHYVSEWWKQLYGESEGKDQKGLFPASVDLTTDLHSMGQFIQDGARIMFETVMNVEKPRCVVEIKEEPVDLDGLNYLAGKDMDFVNKNAMNGTILAHTDGNVPNLMVKIPEQNEFYLGELFYFFEFACGLSGYLLGVNPFNQPGVESYKRNMFALLGKPGYEAEREELLKRL